jgi:hypothetical protein
MLFAALGAFAQNAPYQVGPFSQDASLAVCSFPASGNPCTNLATIFSTAAGAALNNPIFIKAGAIITFYAAGNPYVLQYSGPGGTSSAVVNIGGGSGSGVGAGPIFVASANLCLSAANCVQWVDDDSTDNCGTATTNWLAAINAYSGKGVPQVWITGSGTGKAFKFATNSCVLNFNVGVNLILQATLDCAQASQGCIQLGATATSGTVATYNTFPFEVSGGGGLIGGTALTGSGGNGSGKAAGIYVMPLSGGGINIHDIFFGPSGTQKGFGTTSTNGTCTNYSIYFDFPLSQGRVAGVQDSVNSGGTTAGGCGFGNPNGATTGSNTVFFEHNFLWTNGVVGGNNQCGSVAIQDGGTLGEVEGNNIYGFGIPINVLGINHRIIANQIDAAGCLASSVGAAIQVGVPGGGSGAVGPITVNQNSVQVAASHTTFLLALAGSTSNTLLGATLTDNINNDPASAIAPSTLLCTPAGVLPCTMRGNQNLTETVGCPASSNVAFQSETRVVDCYLSAQGANIGVTNLIASINSTPVVTVSCNVAISRAATTSSTLPNCLVAYTDATNNTAVTAQVTPAWAINTPGCAGSATNTLGNACSGVIVINPAAGSNIQFSTNSYATSGATSMQFAINVVAQIQ